MKKKVKHHGFAHLVLIILLFLVAYLVFGGGKLSTSLSLGAAIFSLVQSGGQVSGALTGSALQLIVIFIINLLVYYVLAAILIFLYNLVFGKKE